MPGTEQMTAQDRLDVMELIARYAQCIDGGDLEGYVANFTPDAVIEWQNGRCDGQDEIREWAGEMMRTGQVGGDPAVARHFAGMPYVQGVPGDAARCTARTYVIMFTLGEAGVRVPFVGSYTDVVRKLDGAWLFEKRVIAADLGGFRSNRR